MLKMEKLFFVYWIFVSLSIIGGIDACSQLGSSCSTNADCCSISNGRTYCNVENNRCNALRYCDESSPNDCPFNDLSSTEISNAIKIIRKSNSFSKNIQFLTVRTQEPKKKQWNSGDKAAKERVAYAAIYDMRNNSLSDVLISLPKQSIISINQIPDGIGSMTGYEYELAQKIAAKDPRVTKAYERRGLNASYAAFDVWAYGAQGPNQGNVPGRRRVKIVANYQDPETKYMDWRPVEGLSMTIDIADKKIIAIIDKGNVPVPTAPRLPKSVDDHKMPSKNSDAAPSSIEVNGFLVKWQNWNFQYSMDPVHGLQLYHLRYLADCEERFLIYKISISEMFVPYGASGETWRFRGAFDAGEYRLGSSASPIMLGQDVPSNAKLLSCPQVDDTTGEVTELEGCIAIYERDVSPLYYHYEQDTKRHEVKSGSELVITFMCTVGNYDYMFDYAFSMDGNIMPMVMATGLLLPRAVTNKKNDPDCIEDCQDYIHENTIGPLHQHFFNYRIDFDIDGANNLLTEVDFVNDPVGRDNKDGGAFSLRRKVIPKETFLDYSAENARFWNVINAQSRNEFNTPRGYSLYPASLASTFLKNGNPLNQAKFILHPIWVTAYDDSEQGAAGDFPRSGKKDQGLPTYIKDGASLRNRDIVVWHTFGLTHAPRPEEYPYMNKMGAGFSMMSRSFQSSNPVVLKKCSKQ